MKSISLRYRFAVFSLIGAWSYCTSICRNSEPTVPPSEPANLPKGLLPLGCPLSWSTGMTSLVQLGQAQLAPPLPPLFDTVQRHAEFIRSFLKSQASAQAQNPLSAQPCPRIRMNDAAHLTQLTLLVPQLIPSASSLNPCCLAKLTLTAKIVRLPPASATSTNRRHAGTAEWPHNRAIATSPPIPDYSLNVFMIRPELTQTIMMQANFCEKRCVDESANVNV